MVFSSFIHRMQRNNFLRAATFHSYRKQDTKKANGEFQGGDRDKLFRLLKMSS
jgi:hypothetical protein